jgi:hypothetical protein
MPWFKMRGSPDEPEVLGCGFICRDLAPKSFGLDCCERGGLATIAAKHPVVGRAPMELPPGPTISQPPLRTGEVTMSTNAAIAALIALAAATAGLGTARADAMQNDVSTACSLHLRGALHADGETLKGFDRRRSGFGQLPRDAVIECLGDGETQRPL